MKRKVLLLAAVVVSMVIIVALIPSIQNPEIYKKTPGEYTTPFHTDPGLYVKSDLNSSESSLLLMQDMLDISGPITLNIRISDPESAAEDLARYKNLLGSMNKLIIKIEMSQSDLDEYLAAHKDNEQILSDLLNETQDLNKLKELEIQFIDQENPGSYVSVIYQESAIRNRIADLYNRYNDNREDLNKTATKYGLNTTGYDSSIENFSSIVEKETENQVILDSRVKNIRKSIANQTKDSLNMGISPSVVRYGDIVTIQGNLNSAKNRSQFVMLNIDNQGITGTRINFKGDYEFHYSIRKITSGQHTVYISSGGIFSDPGSFTVIPVNSMTSLSVPLSSDQPWVNITGRLYTSEGVQVLDAPVIITRDRTNTIEVTTGDEGQYFTSIDLPNGNHTLQAIFQGTGYPVNPSKSQVSKINVQYQVPVKPKAFPWFSIAVLGGALVISSGAAVFYLRRQRTLSLIRPARHETLPEDITLTELPHEVLTPENTRQEAGEIQQGQGQGELELSIKEKGFRETAYNIYWEIITLLDNKIPLSAVRSWTTREIAASCQGKSYYQFIRNFIAIYERVRYGPEPLKEEDKARFLEESRDLIAIIRGDKHP